MTGHFVTAFIVLGFLLSPILAYLVYWVWKKVRRGQTGEGEGETEA